MKSWNIFINSEKFEQKSFSGNYEDLKKEIKKIVSDIMSIGAKNGKIIKSETKEQGENYCVRLEEQKWDYLNNKFICTSTKGVALITAIPV